uniref:Receptor-like protein kinase n=1 Tax=Noccaea caerulescens TaxID=107243 RepID=A0A1J3K8U4_NOCCA
MGFLCSLHLLLSLCSYRLLSAQSPPTNATSSSLDSLLQDYSFRAFVRPRTGILYDATAPSNLTGIKIAAMRLRSGSLRKRGVSSFKEFSIPKGVIVKPYVTRLVLVYQNLADFSHLYYPLPGYEYVAPVLGLLAYDAKNLSAINLPELELRASNDTIRIDFSDLERIPQGSSAKCVSFDSQGKPSFSESIQPGNTCETDRQGHFSVVVKSVESAPSPAPPESEKRDGQKKSSGSNSKTWIILGSVVGGLILLGLLLFLVLRCRNYKKQEKMREMERAGETGEALRMTQVGETRAPTATTTRTQPMLETEYAA